MVRCAVVTWLTSTLKSGSLAADNLVRGRFLRRLVGSMRGNTTSPHCMRSRDDGFSVVEVVIASAILFFALTALVGLLGATTNMTTAAKGRSVLTNTVATELDWVRSIPFNRLALTNASPPGDVPPTRTMVKDGYTITVTFTITDRAAQNGTKEVAVQAVASRPGVSDITTTAHAFVRNRVGGTTVEANDAPVIEFIDPTPPTDTIVFANKKQGGSNLQIAARATSEAHLVARMEFLVGGTTSVLLRNGNQSWAGYATETFTDAQSVKTYSFDWHTMQIDSEGQPSVPDGRRVVRIIAYDDQGRASTPRDRTFVVDNHPPVAPTNAQLIWNGTVTDKRASQTLSAGWTAAMDGTDPAPSHSALVYENTNGASDPAQWQQAGGALAAPGVVGGTGAMGAYAIRVRAFSPLQNPGPWTVAGPVYTRPLANGSSDVTRSRFDGARDRWSFTSRPELKGPRFPYADSDLKIELLKTFGATVSPPVDVTAEVKAAWAAGDAYVYTDTVNQVVSKNVQPPVPVYQYRVEVTPAGWGSAKQSLTSSKSSPWVPDPISSFSYATPTNTITATNMEMSTAW